MPEAKGGKPVIRVRDLLVGYGTDTSTAVCPAVNVTMGTGGGLAVVGANGTGKSTVLRAIAGLLKPLAGGVEVFGEPVDERTARFRARVATVLDDDAYLPALTLREHLLLTARGHGQGQVSQLVTEAIEEFGLTERQHAVPTALSSGQRRRLLLASAFVRPRQLLIFDEPEQRLDAGARDRLGRRLLAERAAGGAVVFACHDPALVRAAADRALLIGEDSVRVVTSAAAADAIESL